MPTRGSGIRTGGGISDMSIDALCEAAKEVNRGQVALNEIKAVLVEIRQLLKDNLDQSQAVSTELQAVGASLAQDGRELAEELRNERSRRGNVPPV